MTPVTKTGLSTWYFFDANGIERAEKNSKRAVLLTLIGATTYKLLCSLVAPSKPGEKTYQELIGALTAHFSPTYSPIVCRFKFHPRCRQLGESIAVFVPQLCSLSENCGFGNTLEDMLRDRLVCGICDNAIQKRLLAEHDLNFAKAVQLAQSMEMAAENVKELQQPSGTPNTSTGAQEVLKVTQPRQGEKVLPTCHRCGKTSHKAPQCTVKHLKCGKVGYLRSVCRSKKKNEGRVQPECPVRVVQEEEDLICPLYVLQARNRVPPLQVAMEIDSHQLLMEVDTGAAYSLISDTTFKEFWPDRRLEKSDVRLCTYSGEPIEVLGSLTVIQVPVSGI